MDYLAGIDLGSTSLKCVVYDLDGNVVASGTRPTERWSPYPDHPEWTVWQPEQIWGGAAAAMKEAVAKLDDARHIKAVAVTGMGMDGVPVDEQGGWLYPFISWHDPRTEAQLRWWESHIGADKTFGIGGNTLWRFSTALRLLWMAEHEPGILARTDKWLLIEDFLNFMLCGRRATDFAWPPAHSCSTSTNVTGRRKPSPSLASSDGCCVRHTQWHIAGRGDSSRRPRQPAWPSGRRSCWAGTTICAARCRWEPLCPESFWM